MSDAINLTSLKNLISPALQVLGFELIDCQLVSEAGRKTLRIYVEGPNGLTVADSARINHQIIAILNVEASEYTAYDLEVSSPGLDRPLITPEHFQRFLTKEIRIRLKQPLEGCCHFKGQLLSATQNTVCLLVNGETISVDFDTIRRANLVPDLRF